MLSITDPNGTDTVYFPESQVGLIRWTPGKEPRLVIYFTDESNFTFLGKLAQENYDALKFQMENRK